MFLCWKNRIRILLAFCLISRVFFRHLSCGLPPAHIVSSKKFLRISSSPHWILPNDNYDAPEEVCGKRKLFDRPLKK